MDTSPPKEVKTPQHDGTPRYARIVAQKRLHSVFLRRLLHAVAAALADEALDSQQIAGSSGQSVADLVDALPRAREDHRSRRFVGLPRSLKMIDEELS